MLCNKCNNYKFIVMAGLTRHPLQASRGWWGKSIMAVLLLVLFAPSLYAQTIIEDLQAKENSSEGVISVEAEHGINDLIGKPGAIVNDDTDESVKYTERSGFRIQVSMGNSRTAAQSKQSDIQSLFPNIATYLIYVAPNWKLFAGDFTSREEANMVNKQLQAAFPNFGRAMFVVTSKIKVPVE